MAEANGIEGQKLFFYKLALDEICTNSLKHAYKYESGKVDIVAFLEESYLITEIKDYGCGFLIVEKMHSNNVECDKLENNGKGLLIVKEFTDKVEVNSILGEGTTVRFYMKLEENL